VRDVDPVIARWVKQLGGSGKTISNKHGFGSGAFNAEAVRFTSVA
jgi:integrase